MNGARTTSAPPRWRKLGCLFDPDAYGDPSRPWLASHAALPWADVDADGARVYFSPRDREGRAHIARMDLVGLDGPTPRPVGESLRVLDLAREPILAPGPLGTFDDRGVTMSCLVHHQGRQYLYYTGWTLGTTVSFYLYIGLAVSDDGGRSFERVSPAPILERSAIDPYLTASPSVLIEDGVWRMWYVSAPGWWLKDGRPEPTYHIRYAESLDGLQWQRTGRVCIDFAGAGEYAFGRPCVIRDGGRYRMWYCMRGSAYRIGYAESLDGLAWTRLDDRAGIDVSEAGWDAEMLAYPCVFRAGERLYLLYNGNDYGRSGFGVAVQSWHQEDTVSG
jgi:hypothetical protein